MEKPFKAVPDFVPEDLMIGNFTGYNDAAVFGPTRTRRDYRMMVHRFREKLFTYFGRVIYDQPSDLCFFRQRIRRESTLFGYGQHTGAPRQQGRKNDGGFHGWPFFLLLRAFCLWLLVRLRFSGFVLSKKPERGAAQMRANGSDTVIVGEAIKAPKARMAALFMVGLFMAGLSL
jgi:hypothetical protein